MFCCFLFILIAVSSACTFTAMKHDFSMTEILCLNCYNWRAPWKNWICSTTMKLRKSFVKTVMRQKTCNYIELFGSSAQDRYVCTMTHLMLFSERLPIYASCMLLCMFRYRWQCNTRWLVCWCLRTETSLITDTDDVVLIHRELLLMSTVMELIRYHRDFQLPVFPNFHSVTGSTVVTLW